MIDNINSIYKKKNLHIFNINYVAVKNFIENAIFVFKLNYLNFFKIKNQIPKILHQVWLGGEMPVEFRGYQKKWKELHPDWEYMLWTEENIINTPIFNFVQDAKQFSSKSNIIRIYAILNYGGVYADTDVDWNKNIDCLLKFESFASKEIEGGWYGNAFFGAKKGHPWIKSQYNDLAKYVEKDPPWGPALMTEAVSKCKKGFQAIPTKYCYPYVWNTPFRPASDFSQSYIVHYWNMSWKK